MSGIPPVNFLAPNSLSASIQQHEQKESEEEKAPIPIIRHVAAAAMDDIPVPAAAAASVLSQKRKFQHGVSNKEEEDPQNKAARIGQTIGIGDSQFSSAAAAAAESELTPQEKNKRALLNATPTEVFRPLLKAFEGTFAGTKEDFIALELNIDNLEMYILNKQNNDEIIEECLNTYFLLLSSYLSLNAERQAPLKPFLPKLLFITNLITLLGKPKHFVTAWLIFKKLDEVLFGINSHQFFYEEIEKKKKLLVEENLRQWCSCQSMEAENNEGYEKASKEILKSLISEIDCLNLSHCDLSSLPECFKVCAFTEVNLSHNRLTHLPEDCFDGDEEILVIDLSFNSLTTLPLGVCDLVGLRVLKINDNPALSSLPLELSESRFLNRIDFDNTAIPESDVEAMIQLCLSHEKNLSHLKELLDEIKQHLPSHEYDLEPLSLFPAYLKGQLKVYLADFWSQIAHPHKTILTGHLLKNLMSSPTNRQIFLLLMEHRQYGDDIEEAIIDLDIWQGFADKRFLVDVLTIIPPRFRMNYYNKISLLQKEERLFSQPNLEDEARLTSLFLHLLPWVNPDYLEMKKEIVKKMRRMLRSDPKGQLTQRERRKYFAYAHRVLISFNLPQNDELRDCAQAAFTKFDPDFEKYKTHPYRLFDELKHLYKTEQRLSTGPILPIALANQEGVSSQENVAINLDNLRERAAKIFYTVADLPPFSKDIGLNYFNDLFASIKARLSGTSLNMQAEVRDVFVTLFDLNFSYMRLMAITSNQEELAYIINYCENLCLGSETRLSELLIIPKQKETVIKDVQYYLFCCMKSFEEESNESQAGTFFSPRELQALKFLNILKHCEVGKDEEIISYYNLLPPKYRETVIPVGATAKISQLCNHLIQKLIDEVINDQRFLDDVSLIPHVRQQVHQKRFIKNRFAHQIGLRHALEFDEGSTTIAENLIASLEAFDLSKQDNPPQKFLNKFYQFFTPQCLFVAFKRRIVESAKKAKTINEELDDKLAQKVLTASQVKKEKAIRYQAEHLITEQDLTTFLTESGIAQLSMGEVNWGNYLHYNEDYTEFNGLHDSTIVAILKCQKILVTQTV